LLKDVPIPAPPGLPLRFPIAPPFSPILEDDADNGGLYPDSESEAESHASSEASVHSEDVCVILAFLEPKGVRESVAMMAKLSSRIEWRTLDLTTTCYYCDMQLFHLKVLSAQS
jgi:hypothetical protein